MQSPEPTSFDPQPQRPRSARRSMMLVVGLAMLGCGIDNVERLGPGEVEVPTGGSASGVPGGEVPGGEANGLIGGASPVGGAGTGGEVGVGGDNTTPGSGGSETSSAGGAPATSSGGSSLLGPTEFFACLVGSERLEVRGVRGDPCWLVVLENRAGSDACHADVPPSRGWCVTEVVYGATRATCAAAEPENGEPQNAEPQNDEPESAGAYQSSGTLQMSEDGAVSLDLDFRSADGTWQSDVPFAVSYCRANCAAVDCRR